MSYDSYQCNSLDMADFLGSNVSQSISEDDTAVGLNKRKSDLVTSTVDFSLESDDSCFVFDVDPDVNDNQKRLRIRLSSDSMETGGISMDTSSPMSSMSSMSGSADIDIKPNISQLNVSTANNGGYGGLPVSSGVNSQGYGGNVLQNSHPQGHPPPYYGLPPGMPPSNHSQVSPGGGGSGGMPLQSPTLSSMSPANALSSPPTSLTPLQSPSSSMGSPPPGLGSMGGLGGPQSMTKHICAICGDRASGKHYGVYSCEGCKGFFKRTVRKDLTYACRDDKKCQIDKRQRNRCQYCRYMKCLSMGMKREAVQEERQRGKDGKDEVESTSCANSEMPVEKILEAELAVETKTDQYMDSQQQDTVQNICQAADKQLFSLVEWAKRIPHFTELPLEDQVILLRAGWNELLIAGFSHRSVSIRDGILLSTGLHVHRSTAHQAGVGTIFDRVLTELVAKMREMKMDLTELGCLRAIVLFNPDAKNLQAIQEVEAQREKVYASLEEYCKSQYPDEPGRFAKLLLRLPALRSIGLKCMEHLFFFKLIGDTPIDTFLMEMLENPNPS